jgi:uncharacterized protein (DUF433 family)
MPKALNKYISVDPSILGGTPVVSGTRIPISRIISLKKMGYNSHDLIEDYPHLSLSKIRFIEYILMKQGWNAIQKGREV